MNRCLSIERSKRAELRRYVLAQSEQSKASAVLASVGGDEKKAAQVLRFTQNPEYADKAVLFSKMVEVAGFVKHMQAQGQAATRGAAVHTVRSTAAEYAAHLKAFNTLPPAGPIVVPNNPMQPVPNLRTMVATAKTELTPAFLAQRKAEGLTYTGVTVGNIFVRHGETNQNAVAGGVAGGSIRGPWGAQLLPESRQAASNLRGTIQAIADQKVVTLARVSTVNRAVDTYRLATQNVTGLPTAKFEPRLNEYKVGGFGNLPKVAPGNPKYVSKYDWWFGRSALTGSNGTPTVGVDFNNMPTSWAPPSDPVYPNAPRFGNSPVTAQPETESRDQHFTRVAQTLNEDFSQMKDGDWRLDVSHQFTGGNEDAHVFRGDAAGDRMVTGKGIKNTAPQYWVIHLFKDAQGNLVPVASQFAGQGDLAAPGTNPKKH